MCVCVRVCVCLRARTHVCVCAHVCMTVVLCLRVCVCLCVYVRICMHFSFSLPFSVSLSVSACARILALLLAHKPSSAAHWNLYSSTPTTQSPWQFSWTYQAEMHASRRFCRILAPGRHHIYFFRRLVMMWAQKKRNPNKKRNKIKAVVMFALSVVWCWCEQKK